MLVGVRFPQGWKKQDSKGRSGTRTSMNTRCNLRKTLLFIFFQAFFYLNHLQVAALQISILTKIIFPVVTISIIHNKHYP